MAKIYFLGKSGSATLLWQKVYILYFKKVLQKTHRFLYNIMYNETFTK